MPTSDTAGVNETMVIAIEYRSFVQAHHAVIIRASAASLTSKTCTLEVNINTVYVSSDGSARNSRAHITPQSLTGALSTVWRQHLCLLSRGRRQRQEVKDSTARGAGVMEEGIPCTRGDVEATFECHH